MTTGPRKFSPDEIVAATANYKKVIGRGGFGPVYYGRLTDGREVAVKVLDKESRQGETEFLNEVDNSVQSPPQASCKSCRILQSTRDADDVDLRVYPQGLPARPSQWYSHIW